MATVDLSTFFGTGLPWDGINKTIIIHQRIAATVAKPLVSGDTYRLWDIKNGVLARCAWYKIVTLDAGGGTITINFVSTADTIVPLTVRATSGAAGTAIHPVNTATFNKWFEAAGHIDMVIGTANLTTAVFDLFVELTDCTVGSTHEASILYAS